jgi:PhnB protein
MPDVSGLTGRSNDKIFRTTAGSNAMIDDMAQTTNTARSLTPRLVVSDPDSAAEFYRTALDAELRGRFTLPDGTVTNIDLVIGDASISLTSEVEAWGLLAPGSAGGNPILLRLTVADARRLSDRMLEAGATEVVPVEDRPYGRCEGRIRDPFGHLWILSHVTEDLSDEEIRRRLDAAYGDE